MDVKLFAILLNHPEQVAVTGQAVVQTVQKHFFLRATQSLALQAGMESRTRRMNASMFLESVGLYF